MPARKNIWTAKRRAEVIAALRGAPATKPITMSTELPPLNIDAELLLTRLELVLFDNRNPTFVTGPLHAAIASIKGEAETNALYARHGFSLPSESDSTDDLVEMPAQISTMGIKAPTKRNVNREAAAVHARMSSAQVDRHVKAMTRVY